MNSFETFRLELPLATYNILQGNIDLTLSLSATLSSVVIVCVWCKTNKGSNWPNWQESLVSNNGSPSPTKEPQQWTVTSTWPEETISSPLKPWNVKYEPRTLVHPRVKQECAINFLQKQIWDLVVHLTWEDLFIYQSGYQCHFLKLLGSHGEGSVLSVKCLFYFHQSSDLGELLWFD